MLLAVQNRIDEEELHNIKYSVEYDVYTVLFEQCEDVLNLIDSFTFVTYLFIHHFTVEFFSA
jgi:hypothetical protein